MSKPDRATTREQTDQEILDNLFTYHPPVRDQAERYGRMRTAAKVFAKELMFLTPRCPDQSAALRKIREAVFTGNAAIACYEPRELKETPYFEEEHTGGDGQG